MNYSIIIATRPDGTEDRYGLVHSVAIQGTVFMYSWHEEHIATFAWYRDDLNLWEVPNYVNEFQPMYVTIWVVPYDPVEHRENFVSLSAQSNLVMPVKDFIRSIRA
jgi:hypothetical protein